MKKKIMTMILTTGILLGLTACSSYEPLVSRDGAATGSAVSGNSVTSVVSGGAVEGNSKDRQDDGNEENSEKTKTGLPWSQWYRNCNSNKMYRTSYQEKDKEKHLVQIDLNGREKKKVLKTKADEILWVTDEWICINDGNKIYRIPLKHGEDQQESLDTANKECIISDLYYEKYIYENAFCAMDENDIYYLNKDKKVTAYHIPDGSKREISFPSGENLFFSRGCHVTADKVFVGLYDSLYCISRDTLAVEKIDSPREGDFYENSVYMEETDELYFTRITEDYYRVCDTELYVYDGNTTKCVVTREEMSDVLCKTWNISKKSEPYFESFNIYSYDKKIYIEYMIDDDKDEDNCGVLVYDRNGRLYEEEELAKQIKKHFNKEYNYYYDVYGVQGDKMYVVDMDDDDDNSVYCVYNLKTGEMEKVSARTIRLLDNCTDYVKS